MRVLTSVDARVIWDEGPRIPLSNNSITRCNSERKVKKEGMRPRITKIELKESI